MLPPKRPQPPAPVAKTGRRDIPIVLATTVLVTFAPLSRAAAMALADLGLAAFFIAGAALAAVGPGAHWFVLGAVLLGATLRAVDIESWTLFIPRGLTGRVQEAFGPRAATAASAADLLERILLIGLASLVAGHYSAAFLVTVLSDGRFRTQVDLATVAGASLLGVVWIRARMGHAFGLGRVAKRIWIMAALLVALIVFAFATVAARGAWAQMAAPPGDLLVSWSGLGWRDRTISALLLVIAALAGLGYSLSGAGGGEGLTRAANELPPPRVQSLRRMALISAAFGIVVVAPSAFLFSALVGPVSRPLWIQAPLLGIAQHLAAPDWLRFLICAAITVAAVIALTYACEMALAECRNILLRVADERRLPDPLMAPHPRFGTQSNLVDLLAAAIAVVLVVSGGQVTWVARAYAVAIGATACLKIAALTRLRRRRPDLAFRVPLNLRIGRRELPLGLWAIGLLVIGAVLALLASGDGPAWTGIAAFAGLTSILALPPRRTSTAAPPGELDIDQLLPSTTLSLDRLEARPGAVLVPVRNPHSLGHVVAALQTSRDRDVVIMTARMLGPDVVDERLEHDQPTAAERLIFSRVAEIAERYRRPVRLLVVPARNVFDAIVSAVLRLQASEIYVGESVTLSVDAQARLLGEAWERAASSEEHEVHLVIHHSSGRTDTYHIGAHAPSLTSRDLDLIHRLWLDAARSVGPHVHHHDIVRAALTQMAEQLNGPGRDDALQAIRQTAKPADELAQIVRTRDYSRLRDMVRNQPAAELAELLADLAPEEQVLVFRVLPRKDAAAAFEYLTTEVREQLLKGMAKEDVATLLNDMAPDDRTMFLEELPATVTRELLALLTPQERAVALTLLGYPEGSIGRLMTPHYVAVREDWTVQQVLDHVRQHGRDSETLNVIYVVDDGGLLIDDVRIREFLLTSTSSRVTDLMDRHFVALKATDDQQTAVAAFKQYDRSALPVTDSAGMLIGIVTVDDVLDVAEASATKDIQRIGGLEALDEPYMDIAFGRMIQKRAGWLTALFLGEMLTATAMGAFEHEIQKAVVLALFVPLIISSGGNSGSQASTLVIRALALGEVALRDWWRVIRREVGAGLALGGILGGIGFLRISLWSAFSDIYGPHWMLVAITVGFALVGIVLWGTLIGSLLPFLLRRLGFDPATSSAPFVATLVDVTGLIIYFSVALVVLRGTLL
jgi:magnesium transporter